MKILWILVALFLGLLTLLALERPRAEVDSLTPDPRPASQPQTVEHAEAAKRARTARLPHNPTANKNGPLGNHSSLDSMEELLSDLRDSYLKGRAFLDHAPYLIEGVLEGMARSTLETWRDPLWALSMDQTEDPLFRSALLLLYGRAYPGDRAGRLLPLALDENESILTRLGALQGIGWVDAEDREGFFLSTEFLSYRFEDAGNLFSFGFDGAVKEEALKEGLEQLVLRPSLCQESEGLTLGKKCPDILVRNLAVLFLGAGMNQSEDTYQFLEALLEAQTEEARLVRTTLHHLLARNPSPRATQTILQAYRESQDHDPYRIRLLHELVKRKAGANPPEWLGTLERGDVALREKEAILMGLVGRARSWPEKQPHLTVRLFQLTENLEGPLRSSALEVLASSGDHELTHLAAHRMLFEDEVPHNRARAAWALGAAYESFGEKQKPFVHPLPDLLKAFEIWKDDVTRDAIVEIVKYFDEKQGEELRKRRRKN